MSSELTRDGDISAEVTMALDQFPKTVEDVIAFMNGGWKRGTDPQKPLPTSDGQVTQSVEQGSSTDKNQERPIAQNEGPSLYQVQMQKFLDSCKEKEQEIKKENRKSYQTLKNIAARLKTNTVGAMMMIASAPKAAWKGLSKAAKGFVNMICRLVNRKRGTDNTKSSWVEKETDRRNSRSQSLSSGRGRSASVSSV